jgi:hypothetical protein
MDVTPSEYRVHRPGGVSSFFVYKSGFMALACWIWLAVLAVRVDTLTVWHLIAAAGAVATTVVSVILGARHALALASAARHEQVMRTLVDLSWQAFTPERSTTGPASADGDADVIRLKQEPRQRPRR